MMDTDADDGATSYQYRRVGSGDVGQQSSCFTMRLQVSWPQLVANSLAWFISTEGASGVEHVASSR